MDNTYKAQKSSYRKQQVKTYLMRLLIFPKIIIGGILLIFTFIFWHSLTKFMKSSNMKLTLQREQYKPQKKLMKLDKKQTKKELKHG